MPEEEQNAEEPRKMLPVKTILTLVLLLLIEAAAISLAFVIAGGPADVQAYQAKPDESAEEQKRVEVLVIEDKFANTKRGKTYLYDTRIVIAVRNRDKDEIEAQIEGMKSKITENVRTMISRAEPNQLLEPTLAALKRQIHANLEHLLDSDSTEPRIEEVMIPKFTQHRADF